MCNRISWILFSHSRERKDLTEHVSKVCGMKLYFLLTIPTIRFLGALSNLWKATVSFVMSIHLSLCMEHLGSHWIDFHEILCLSIFKKSVKNIQVSLKLDRYFTGRQCTFFIISCSVLLRMKNVSVKVMEKVETHVWCSVTFFW